MAYVSFDWLVTYTIEDESHRSATISFWFDEGLTAAALVAKAETLAAALEPLTNGRLRSFTIGKSYRSDAPALIGREAEVGRKLSLTFTDAVEKYMASVEVPSPIFEVEQVGTTIADPANAVYVAFVEAVAASGALTHSGTPITKVMPGGRITHRKRKGEK